MAEDAHFATAVVAGTTDPVGVDAVIVDRGDLPEDTVVFLRPDDAEVLSLWTRLAKAGGIRPAPPLDGRDGDACEPEPKSCVTLLAPTRLCIETCHGETLVIDAAQGTRIGLLSPDGKTEQPVPEVGIARVAGQEVLTFSGGSPAAAFPLRLGAGRYVTIVVGRVGRNDRKNRAELRLSQRKGDGQISAGFSVVV